MPQTNETPVEREAGNAPSFTPTLHASRFTLYAWRYTPHAIVFCSSACIMVVELVAGRLIARHLGSSLYTWTSIIAVILAGMSFGNVLGGKLADRWKPERVLGWMFLSSAVIWALTLGVNYLFAETRPLRWLNWPAQIFFSSLLIFILPAVALGTISPAAAKMALARSNRVGATIGSFYAWAVAGSILGTFLTGFWLMMALGSRGVVLSTALCLGILGVILLLLKEQRGPIPTSGSLEIGRLSPPAPQVGGKKGDPPIPAGGALVNWRYMPYLIAFFTAACMMAVELLASRMIARQLGSSLYTWTSVIGVVLAGVSIGSFVAGRLADRFKPERLLGWLFLLSSAVCFLTLFLNHWFWMDSPQKNFGFTYLKWILELGFSWESWPSALHWPGLVFLTVLCIFFLPSLVLGTFSPVAAKMALRDQNRIGFTLGSVSAWGAAGSIVGTLATGFWLISTLGTKGLMLVVAWGLAAAGLCYGPWRLLHAVWVAVLLAALLISRDSQIEKAVVGYFPASENSHGRAEGPTQTVRNLIGKGISKTLAAVKEARDDMFNAESKYQYIRVYPTPSLREEGKRTLRVLALDFLVHGYVDPDDPGHLEYDYERVYAAVARKYAQGRKDIAALFLGGGSYTFPRWTQAEWPGARIVVAEIDPLVIEANYQALGLRRDTPIRTIPMDARIAVDSLAENELFDFVLGDAFNDLSSPYHLSTLEFDQKVKRHLKPGGAYLVNVIDSYECGLLVGSLTATLKRVFKQVCVFCTKKEGVKESRDTFVIAASDVPLDTAGWEPGHPGDFCGSVLTDEQMAELARKSGNRVLTDDDAPVENLIAPVLRKRKQP